MTQSAMSHLIRNLEGELEVKLLSRGARKVLPTSAGRVLYGHAKRILDGYRQMDRDMEGLSKDVRGRLRLGATQTIAAFLLPHLLYDFLRLHPSARVHLSVFNNDGVIRELREGGLDIGIIENSLKDKSLAAERFAEDEMVVVAAEDNPLAREKDITASDLLSQPFILPETGSGTRESIDDWFRHLGIDPAGVKEILTVGSPELLVQLVQSGLGISVVSKWSAFKPVKEGALKVLPVAGRRWTRRFYIVSREGEPSTLAARTLKDFVKSYRFFAPF